MGSSDLRLRLVCKAFNRAMIRAFFKHRAVVLRLCKPGIDATINEFFLGDEQSLTPLISRLRIE